MKVYNPGEAPDPPTGGIIVLYGLAGSGKTTLALSGKDIATTCYFANFDRSASKIIKKAGLKIYEEKDFPHETQQQAMVGMQNLVDLHQMACEAEEGIFVVDNAAAMWDMIKMAKIPPAYDKDGQPLEPLPKAYVDANAFYDGFLKQLIASNIWVVLTAPAKERWEKAKSSTGELIADGWRRIDYYLLAEFYLECVGTERGVEPGLVAAEDFDTPSLKWLAKVRVAKEKPIVQGMVLPAKQTKEERKAGEKPDKLTLSLLLKTIGAL